MDDLRKKCQFYLIKLQKVFVKCVPYTLYTPIKKTALKHVSDLNYCLKAKTRPKKANFDF